MDINTNNAFIEKQIDLLKVQVYQNRRDMGTAVALDIAKALRQLLEKKEEVRIVFAAAPSQNEMLANLATAADIDWSRVTVFHMDEYIGLTPGAPQSFGRFLTEKLFSSVKPGRVHIINSIPIAAATAECDRYTRLYQAAPIDIICLGIGENGHIAFNDPPVADFNDTKTMNVVELEHACRQQQVNDGCFTSIEQVPTHALTLTIPAIISAARLFCVVPGTSKSAAVYRVIHGIIGTACPATILRTHPHCTLYLDEDSYGGQQ